MSLVKSEIQASRIGCIKRITSSWQTKRYKQHQTPFHLPRVYRARIPIVIVIVIAPVFDTLSFNCRYIIFSLHNMHKCRVIIAQHSINACFLNRACMDWYNPQIVERKNTMQWIVNTAVLSSERGESHMSHVTCHMRMLLAIVRVNNIVI